MSEMSQIQMQVIEWAKARDLIEGSTPQRQLLKLAEEVGELAGAIARENAEAVIDAIGDIMVVLTIIKAQTADTSFFVACEDKDLYRTLMDITDRRVSAFTDLHDEVSYIAIRLKHLDEEPVPILPPPNEKAILDALRTLAQGYSSTLVECFASAYRQIKDRKGRMINGVFVKAEELCA